MATELTGLLKIIETKLDWGESSIWQTKDFDKLNQLIFEQTDISLSSSTLRRLWGKAAYNHTPNTTTLDALAKFAGYEDWRTWLRLQSVNPVVSEAMVSNRPAEKSPSLNIASQKRSTIIIAALILVAVVVFLFISGKRSVTLNKEDYSFNSKPVTRGIPNSVVFTYDATRSPTDSVFIQQSWDAKTKTKADKQNHEQTSIYYEPGFYKAKLFVGDSIVKEHPLLVPSNGWLGLISRSPIPVYLSKEEFMKGDSLQVPEAVIQQKNIQMEPEPPFVKYFNIGNFEPVPVNNFSFETEIKNEYSTGSGACQFSFILLVTDAAPIIIPLSAKGCVSKLNLRCVDEVIMGKDHDLSGLGADFNTWVKVSCRSEKDKISFSIDNKTVYVCKTPLGSVHIVGISFAFQGTGAARKINLYKGGLLAFHSF